MTQGLTDKLLLRHRQLLFPRSLDQDGMVRFHLLAQLDESQWWSADRLLQRQFQQLQSLLVHADATVPWYRERFRDCGWSPDSVLDEQLWSRLPLLSRDDIHRAGIRLNATSVRPGHGRLRRATTSGSTGNPITVTKTGWQGLIWDVVTLRDHFWQQRDFSESVAIIRHFPKGKAEPPAGKTSDSWGPPVSKMYRTGAGAALNIVSNVSVQLDWLLDINPGYLLTFPSNAEALVRLSLQRGHKPERLREIRTIGETLSPEQRHYIEAGWNVRVTDCYSAQEIGYIALQAPGADHYLVQSEAVRVDILDESGRPCGPGESGRVVLTPLHSFATPLIRYVIGDYAVPGHASPCGRGLPVLERILGRSRNMLRLPDGDQRFAATGIKTFNTENGNRIQKYQVVQTALDHLEVRLMMHQDAYTAAEESALCDHIRDRMGYPFAMTVRYVEDIPQGAGGKYEDFRCEIPGA